MTTSGTTVFNPNFIDAIEEAYERAGVESRSGYDMRSARRSINLLFADWANRGINMWTVEERTQTLTNGTAAYTLESDIVDLMDHMIEIPNTTQETRYNLTRVSVSTHAGRTNPDITGRPTEIYINRLRDAPVINLWPSPNLSGFILHYWVLRRIEDAGAYTNTGDMPFRFLPAFVAGLAYLIASKKQATNEPLIARLQAVYEAEFRKAAEEDREKATLTLTPRAGAYRI